MDKLVIFLLILGLSSCGMIQNIALNTTSDIFHQASYKMEEESDWEHFKVSTPSNLQLVEGLSSMDPGNEKLLAVLIKGYGGYGFAVHETSYLRDKYKDKENSAHQDRASRYYTKAIAYGEKLLRNNDTSFYDLVRVVKEEGSLNSHLDNKLGSDDHILEAMVFYAQSIGSLINYNKDSMTLVAQLPVVKGVFDWVCLKKPDIQYGVCEIFYGSYAASRPRMLGGDPQKAKKIFEKAIEDYPNNWLVRVQYLEHYAIPMLDEDVYKAQKYFLNKAAKINESDQYWAPLEQEDKALAEKRLRFYQAVAMKRYQVIRSLEKEIF